MLVSALRKRLGPSSSAPSSPQAPSPPEGHAAASSSPGGSSSASSWQLLGANGGNGSNGNGSSHGGSAGARVISSTLVQPVSGQPCSSGSDQTPTYSRGSSCAEGLASAAEAQHHHHHHHHLAASPPQTLAAALANAAAHPSTLPPAGAPDDHDVAADAMLVETTATFDIILGSSMDGGNGKRGGVPPRPSRVRDALATAAVVAAFLIVATVRGPGSSGRA
jgi:hypothetical protein